MAAKIPSPGLFIAGLVAGLALGAFVLMPVAVLTMVGIFNRLNANPNLGFLVIYALVVGLGAWGLWLVRARIGFLSGFMIGSAAGLLGLTALCNSIIGTSLR
ncbi:MAG: hypothetical protein WA814_09355 [Candidatus Baltobacteraceae bacterium]